METLQTLLNISGWIIIIFISVFVLLAGTILCYTGTYAAIKGIPSNIRDIKYYKSRNGYLDRIYYRQSWSDLIWCIVLTPFLIALDIFVTSLLFIAISPLFQGGM